MVVIAAISLFAKSAATAAPLLPAARENKVRHILNCP